VGRYTLTIRHGSDVERERFHSLDEALAELERRAEAIRGEGPLEDVKMIRDYDAAAQVHARLELSGGGLLRRDEAGLDVMGDGNLVPYSGAIRKRRLEPGGERSAYDLLRDALEDR
jgi:hypothetical protein